MIHTFYRQNPTPLDKLIYPIIENYKALVEDIRKYCMNDRMGVHGSEWRRRARPVKTKEGIKLVKSVIYDGYVQEDEFQAYMEFFKFYSKMVTGTIRLVRTYNGLEKRSADNRDAKDFIRSKRKEIASVVKHTIISILTAVEYMEQYSDGKGCLSLDKTKKFLSKLSSGRYELPKYDTEDLQCAFWKYVRNPNLGILITPAPPFFNLFA